MQVFLGVRVLSLMGVNLYQTTGGRFTVRQERESERDGVSKGGGRAEEREK